MEKYVIHDNVLPNSLVNDVFNWALEQEFYCDHFWTKTAKDNATTVWPENLLPLPVNFNPRRDRGDNQNSGPWLGKQDNIIDRSLLTKRRTGLYRHPIGWSNETVQSHSPLIWEVFEFLNREIFEGTASINGIGEGLAMFGRDDEFQNIESSKTWTDYGFESINELISFNNSEAWKCFINARHHNYGSPTYFKRGPHKDSSMEAVTEEWENYYSVLINLNPIWLPSWEGELILYDETVTGEKTPNDNLNVGWPVEFIPHVPGRVTIYDHRITHATNRPTGHADNLAYKLAFRVHATSVKGI